MELCACDGTRPGNASLRNAFQTHRKTKSLFRSPFLLFAKSSSTVPSAALNPADVVVRASGTPTRLQQPKKYVSRAFRSPSRGAIDESVPLSWPRYARHASMTGSPVFPRASRASTYVDFFRSLSVDILGFVVLSVWSFQEILSLPQSVLRASPCFREYRA